MLESFSSTVIQSLFVPGTAVGVLAGLILTFLAFNKGWVSAGIVAKENSELKAENARLVAELKAALTRVEELTGRLEPWLEWEREHSEALRAEKQRGSTDG